MILRVNATRMELLKLRRRLEIARRGHKLLKDKQDELMRHFLALIEENRNLRQEVERKLMRAHSAFLMARAVMDRASLEAALMFPKQRISIGVGTERVMNLQVPRLRLSSEGDVHAYGLISTSGELDTALKLYSEVLPDMIRLAQMERALQLLAEEIERTRRRVNALEYVLIPNLEDTIRYIRMRLDEMERSSTVRLMKIKEMLAGRR